MVSLNGVELHDPGTGMGLGQAVGKGEHGRVTTDPAFRLWCVPPTGGNTRV